MYYITSVHCDFSLVARVCRASSILEGEDRGEDDIGTHREVGDASTSRIQTGSGNEGENKEPKKHGLEALGSRLSNLQQNILNRQESLNGSVKLDA